MISNKFYAISTNSDPRDKNLHHNDPRAWKFNEAIIKELEELVTSETWKTVCREEVSPYANILNSRFALAVKDEGTKTEIWKARLVVQGHRDSVKQSILHKTSVARQQSTKLIVWIAAICGFQLYSSDVALSYLEVQKDLWEMFI